MSPSGLCPGPSCDGDDCWPPDLDVDREADISDVLKFKPIFQIGFPCEGEPGYERRFDLDVNACIAISDVFKHKPIVLASCTPSAAPSPHCRLTLSVDRVVATAEFEQGSYGAAG